uniref:Uncharacterized protein n=1 Tax=Panagrolaimus davidi TaxID=227884 RepID=A0A914R1I0_9BILA
MYWLCYANLLIDECGINYVEFSKQEHICIPQKYTPSKFSECKKLSQNEFELFPNTKGTPDSRIIILNSLDQNLGYEYKFTDKFNCSQCLFVAKKRIMVKLITNENGEKCLELNKNEHLCQKLNFYKLGRIIYSNEYETGNDKENQTIAVKHPKDKKLYYKFEYDNDLKIFYCVG